MTEKWSRAVLRGLGSSNAPRLPDTIRKFRRKTLVKPQKDKVQAKLREIKDWLHDHPNVQPETVIEVLNPILRGWANYYKHAVSKEVFATFDHHLVHALIRWAKRRHPSKGVRWVIPRYFGTIEGDRWVFKARARDRQEQWRDYYLYRLEMTKIVRHTKVQGRASPDDPALADYWTQRQTKYGKTYYPADSKLYRVAKRQGWKCPNYHDHLFNGERIHTHHVQQVAKGGSDADIKVNTVLTHFANLDLTHPNTHQCFQ